MSYWRRLIGRGLPVWRTHSLTGQGCVVRSRCVRARTSRFTDGSWRTALRNNPGRRKGGDAAGGGQHGAFAGTRRLWLRMGDAVRLETVVLRAPETDNMDGSRTVPEVLLLVLLFEAFHRAKQRPTCEAYSLLMTAQREGGA